MAKYNNGYLGAFNGKLGPAVGYTWKGRSCMRARNQWPHNPRTKKQQNSRTVFGTVSKLASGFRPVIKIGMRGEAAERKITEMDLFISLNRQCVDIVEHEPVIDYDSLMVADGDLPPVLFDEPAIEGNWLIGVDYAQIAGRGGCYNDYVYLVAYSPAVGRSTLSMPTARSGNHISIIVDPFMAASEIYLYGFTWDRGLRASPSFCLGSITF